ncbi:MAG: hypothetical protein COW79_04405, partial [Bdellovibrionales bacterium CG22_combo_CG10-13_8_21_14_all_38_13]
AQTSLSEFPVWLCKLSKLTELDLGHNNLTKLPVEFSYLENLKRLILDSNK